MKRRTGSYVAAVVFAIPFLFPFYLLLRNAVMTQAELGALEWSWWPSEMSFQGFTDAFGNSSVPLGRALVNSTIVAVVSAPVSTLLASMAGYALARIRIPLAKPVFVFVIATMMVPGAATFVPTFVVVGSMGGVNSLWGLIVPGLFNAFAVLLFRAFYLRFPQEVEDAGRVDGLGPLGVYLRLALPNSGGLLAALGVLSFIEHWNSFLWPLVIGQDPGAWTVQVALSSYTTGQTVVFHQIFMATAISILPLLFVFLFLQRWLVQGIAQTGIKG